MSIDPLKLFTRAQEHSRKGAEQARTLLAARLA